MTMPVETQRRRPSGKAGVAEPIETRFMRFVAKRDNGCWEWTGSSTRGYGRIIAGSRADGTRSYMMAHRLSYLLFRGEIGEFYVCHHCDNRRCVNPDHLFLGTHTDNVRDAMSKGLIPALKGESSGRAKLREADLGTIRSLVGEGRSFRSLARQFGVCHSTIARAFRSETWSHLTHARLVTPPPCA